MHRGVRLVNLLKLSRHALSVKSGFSWQLLASLGCIWQQLALVFALYSLKIACGMAANGIPWLHMAAVTARAELSSKLLSILAENPVERRSGRFWKQAPTLFL